MYQIYFVGLQLFLQQAFGALILKSMQTDTLQRNQNIFNIV